MLLVKAKVGKSALHGLGVIAQEFIPKGTVVWKLKHDFDVLLTSKELEQLPVHTRNLVLWYGHFDTALQKYVLPSDDDRFTNHSSDANVRFFGDHSIAIRDIQIGEEMTDNYTEYGKSVDFLEA